MGTRIMQIIFFHICAVPLFVFKLSVNIEKKKIKCLLIDGNMQRDESGVNLYQMASGSNGFVVCLVILNVTKSC